MRQPFPHSAIRLIAVAFLIPATGASLRAQEGSATTESQAITVSTPIVFNACYVPSAGTVYLIGEPGLATECATTGRHEHVPFSWTDGLGTNGHGELNGLGDDDHPQYLLADGSRTLAGDLNAGGFTITGLVAATEAGQAVRFEQAVKTGDAAAGDLSGTYPGPTVAALQGTGVSATAPTQGQVLSFDGTDWTPSTPPSGVTDHGGLTGRDDDDHEQYLLIDGVRAATDGFAVTGTAGLGSIPLDGAGTRLMWYAGRAALRAGHVTADQWDDAGVGEFSAAFGRNTVASGEHAFAAGVSNVASGRNSVALGSLTRAEGFGALAVGTSSSAEGNYSSAIGYNANAPGDYSTARGVAVFASGNRSTAIGAFAATDGQEGAFVYGDNSTTGLARASDPNQFVVRAQHFWLGTNNAISKPPSHFLTTSTGAYLSSGGTWTNSSDVNRKHMFDEVDPEGVLRGLASLSIREWSYRDEGNSVRHVGPTAQDFHAAFGLGPSETAISTVDADGINMLAIQALEKRTAEQARRIEALEAGIAAVRADLNRIMEREGR